MSKVTVRVSGGGWERVVCVYWSSLLRLAVGEVHVGSGLPQRMLLCAHPSVLGTALVSHYSCLTTLRET